MRIGFSKTIALTMVILMVVVLGTATVAMGATITPGTYVTPTLDSDAGSVAATISVPGTEITYLVYKVAQGGEIGEIQYIDQATSNAQGAYTFDYRMKEGYTAGEYAFAIGGTDVDEPEVIAFTIEPNAISLKITGTASSSGNKSLISVVAKKDNIPVGNPVNANADGVFEIAGLEPGTYSIEITKAGHLMYTITGIPVVAVDVALAGTKALKPGNSDANNAINIFDITTILGVYGKASGAPGFDLNADIDDSGGINIFDLTAVLGSYGSVSTVEAYTAE